MAVGDSLPGETRAVEASPGDRAQLHSQFAIAPRWRSRP